MCSRVNGTASRFCLQLVTLVQAGAKSTAATSLKFQAEATAHLQNTGVGRTQDAAKYQDQDIEVRRAKGL